jgi:hypothetical protein
MRNGTFSLRGGKESGSASIAHADRCAAAFAEFSSFVRFANAQENCQRVTTPVRNEGLPSADALRRATLPAFQSSDQQRRSPDMFAPSRRSLAAPSRLVEQSAATFAGPMTV